MKTIIITLSAACAVVATYFGIRHSTHQDIGFAFARKYVRNLVEICVTNSPLHEAAATPSTPSE